MQNLLRVFIASVMPLLVACASSPVLVTPDHYETRVDSDGAKRFEFGVRRLTEAPSLQNMRDGRTQEIEPLRFEQIEDSLQAWMESDGFCRDGFFIYDQRFDGSLYLVLGECRDLATN